MKFIETSGKTVEDAIRSGLKELGCDLGDVNIDILEKGSPGLFGMFGRLAKVRLTVKEADPAFDIEMPRISLDLPKAKPEKKAEPKPRKEKPAKEAKPEPKKEAPAPKPEKKPEPKDEPKPVEVPAAAEPQGEPREKPAQPKKRENRPPRQRRERGPKPQEIGRAHV